MTRQDVGGRVWRIQGRALDAWMAGRLSYYACVRALESVRAIYLRRIAERGK
jgi:hypothetical protein